jgi:hypothetical protein
MQKPRSVIDADEMSVSTTPRWFWPVYLAAHGALAALGFGAIIAVAAFLF